MSYFHVVIFTLVKNPLHPTSVATIGRQETLFPRLQVLHELPHLRAKVLSSQAPQADELEVFELPFIQTSQENAALQRGA